MKLLTILGIIMVIGGVAYPFLVPPNVLEYSLALYAGSLVLSVFVIVIGIVLLIISGIRRIKNSKM